ncbi:hypothetical protein [Candidatus Sororendozoicomonas aggregata]|uniref:hypothetical protein n=1 Tax=Candidatus Sororendozoicomonas aggregata TaxID=3073239 RepID=UPI002ED5B9D2
MGLKSILRSGNSMKNKSLIFLTLVLSLSIMDKAFSFFKAKSCIHIFNDIDQHQKNYSKKGYKFVPTGKGACMHEVYPFSYSAVYRRSGLIKIDYDSSGGCAFRGSAQSFNVINNDTGKVVGKFTWKKKFYDPYLDITNNPGFLKDDTGTIYFQGNALNIWLDYLHPCPY